MAQSILSLLPSGTALEDVHIESAGDGTYTVIVIVADEAAAAQVVSTVASPAFSADLGSTLQVPVTLKEVPVIELVEVIPPANDQPDSGRTGVRLSMWWPIILLSGLAMLVLLGLVWREFKELRRNRRAMSLLNMRPSDHRVQPITYEMQDRGSMGLIEPKITSAVVPHEKESVEVSMSYI